MRLGTRLRHLDYSFLGSGIRTLYTRFHAASWTQTTPYKKRSFFCVKSFLKLRLWFLAFFPLWTIPFFIPFFCLCSFSLFVQTIWFQEKIAEARSGGAPKPVFLLTQANASYGPATNVERIRDGANLFAFPRHRARPWGQMQ